MRGEEEDEGMQSTCLSSFHTLLMLLVLITTFANHNAESLTVFTFNVCIWVDSTSYIHYVYSTGHRY